jgi:hypothetical protein
MAEPSRWCGVMDCMWWRLFSFVEGCTIFIDIYISVCSHLSFEFKFVSVCVLKFKFNKSFKSVSHNPNPNVCQHHVQACHLHLPLVRSDWSECGVSDFGCSECNIHFIHNESVVQSPRNDFYLSHTATLLFDKNLAIYQRTMKHQPLPCPITFETVEVFLTLANSLRAMAEFDKKLSFNV